MTDTKGVLDNTLRVLQVGGWAGRWGGLPAKGSLGVACLPACRLAGGSLLGREHSMCNMAATMLLACPPPTRLQSLVDISADAGWLETALAAMALVQSVMQARLSTPELECCIGSITACCMHRSVSRFPLHLRGAP